MDYTIYVVDTETTGLDCHQFDIIEISLYRLATDEQKTWLLQPTNPANFEPAALRLNGHKIEDLRHETEQGVKLYREPSKILVEIENWLMTDDVPAAQRLCIGQNVSFDMERLEQLWIKCNARDSYPFGRRYMDTMTNEIFLDYCKGEFAEGYSLNSIIKKYGITNIKAHTASADVLATKQVFEKQIAFVKKLLRQGDKD